MVAAAATAGFWHQKGKKMCEFSQMREMGKQVRRRMRTVRLRVRPMRLHWRAPKAWEEMPSMPVARPERTE